jgi:uncharacterized repeat protein (TIGR01451 family)
MLGGFWANIAKTTDGTKRDKLDQAKMQMVQQLLAAMLNEQAFGTSSEGLIEEAKSELCGSDIDEIRRLTEELTDFNEGGENAPFPDDFDPGDQANPKEAQEQAEEEYWDYPSIWMSLEKSVVNADGDGSGDVSVGDILTYTFTATNTGLVELTNVSISDPLLGLSTLVCTPAQPALLAFGDTLECAATYLVTAVDVIAGSIENTATASSEQTPNQIEVVTVDVPTPELSLEKSSSYDDNDSSNDLNVGDVIHYTITATNTGTANLTEVVVGDNFMTISCGNVLPAGMTPFAGTLNVGESVECIGSYMVLDTDLGTTITNIASATSRQDDALDAQEDNEVPMPELSLTKSSSYDDEDNSSSLSVGDVIHYTITATNTGSANLTIVTVSDLFGYDAPLSCEVSNPDDLTPGETIVCMGSYTVVGADQGTTISNTASATSVQDDAPDAQEDNMVPMPPP